MKNIILQKLSKKYTNTKFIFQQQDNLLVLLYNNEELEDNEDFFNYVIDLAYKYLNKEDQLNLSIEYDDFNEV